MSTQNDMRRFGDYEVSILLDGVFEAPVDTLTHVAGAESLQRAIAAFGKPTVQMDVNCFLLRGDQGNILIDTGCGTLWGEHFGKARQALASQGITPEQVDHVLLTHMHGDHAYGLFDGEEPYFSRALVHVPRTELDFFTTQKNRESVLKSRQGGFEVAATLVKLYGDRIRGFDHGPVMPAMQALPLPGHTPGHTGYLVGTADHSVLIWGDMLHLADLQPSDPDLGMIFDIDQPKAAQTRRVAVAEAAEKGWLVAGAHVTGFARVEPTAAGYRVVPA